MFETSAIKERVVKVRSDRKDYSIRMSGTADMDNTTTRHYETFKIGFQPNVSLTIENTGKTTVENPRVVTNGVRRWWCMEELLAEILAGATNDQEKALLIWDFVRRHRHHDNPVFVDHELHDPVKMLCAYGGGLCDDSGAVGSSLLYHAGLNRRKYGKDPKVRSLHGHMMCEAYLDGDFQFLDIDEDTFYLDRENERPVSGDAIVRDHELAKREHAYGPIFKGWRIGEDAASLFGADDGETFRPVGGHRIDMALRPGEKIVYRWDNVGKLARDSNRNRHFWGNSLLVYSPRLGPGDYATGVTEEEGIVVPAPGSGRGKLAGASRDSHLTYEVRSPYVVCGGRVRATFIGLRPRDRFAVSLSLDGQTWKKVWSESGKDRVSCDVELDRHLKIGQKPAKYAYFVRVSLGSASTGTAQLADLELETDIMTSPHSLPRLSLGANKVAYTDDTEEPHEVTVTHRWRESGNVTPPKAPARAVFPRPDAVVRSTTFDFQWSAVPDAERYHIQVSRRQDLKQPYRPCFDVIVEGNRHGSPFAGMFSPGVDYYWRIRSRNRQGLWGQWSRTWRFRWDGPRVPVNVQQHRKGSKIAISWGPNPLGPRPVCYDVYGSDERGFSISKERYYVKGLGERPSNFVARTTDTEMAAVAEDGDLPNLNKSFYRVVAIDENGTESGCSDLVELPHPWVYSKPVRIAAVGVPYRYEVRTLRCLGDLQYRYVKGHYAFWEKEAYEFELVSGPKWLSLNTETGELSGTPATRDVGSVAVEVLAIRLYPDEIASDERLAESFQKTADRFQASHRQRFRIRVRPQS